MMTRGSTSADFTGSRCAADLHWRQLDRRLRAIEQPSEYGLCKKYFYTTAWLLSYRNPPSLTVSGFVTPHAYHYCPANAFLIVPVVAFLPQTPKEERTSSTSQVASG